VPEPVVLDRRHASVIPLSGGSSRRAPTGFTLGIEAKTIWEGRGLGNLGRIGRWSLGGQTMEKPTRDFSVQLGFPLRRRPADHLSLGAPSPPQARRGYNRASGERMVRERRGPLEDDGEDGDGDARSKDRSRVAGGHGRKCSTSALKCPPSIVCALSRNEADKWNDGGRVARNTFWVMQRGRGLDHSAR
jgi:hypothetical protein